MSSIEEGIQNFSSLAVDHLPGLVLCFNLADAKRRNMHLGHLVVDEDIALFDNIILDFAKASACVRVDGATWLAVLQEDQLPALEKLLEDYTLEQTLQVGWKCLGRLNCASTTDESVVRAVITRNIRCAYAMVADASQLTEQVQFLLNNYGRVEPGKPYELSKFKNRPYSTWRGVSDYPSKDPSCPFCGGISFDWEDGDGSIYSGDGYCKNCGAYVNISGIEELE